MDFFEALIAPGALEALFAWLDRATTETGFLPMAGYVVHAMLVATPRQRTEEEKARIKTGASAAYIWPPQAGDGAAEDIDARWTVTFP